jgi:cyanosortase A-associated protein
MEKLAWERTRLLLLALALGGSLVVLGKALIVPFPKAEEVASTTASSPLPQAIPLKDWQAEKTEPVKNEKGAVVGQSYEYRQNGKAITIQMRQEIGDGNVSRYLFVYSTVREANANLQVRYKPGLGHYGVVSHKGQAYLSACINPRGQTTVTDQQFRQNRYAYDLQPGRILPWVLGQQPLLNDRCLWTLMSVPVETNASDKGPPEAAYKTLETAWFSWSEWWQANYPPN